MRRQVPVTDDARALTRDDGSLHELAPDLAYQRLAIVNVAFVSGPDGWTLVDAGMPGASGPIRSAAERRFGEGTRPDAVVLTHGHFDHVGSLRPLLELWDVPVYAHEREHRYLDGSTYYPPPDPGVGGGLMARLSPLYPKGPIDVGRWLRALPADGSIPSMPGWSWIDTPGHTVGHVSLWREEGRVLIAGDAFITTNQESAYAVAVQQPELHGPPMYFTPNWKAAKASVRHLAMLEPELVVSGHGPALAGREMREALHVLARDFDELAVPESGRYVVGDGPGTGASRTLGRRRDRERRPD